MKKLQGLLSEGEDILFWHDKKHPILIVTSTRLLIDGINASKIFTGSLFGPLGASIKEARHRQKEFPLSEIQNPRSEKFLMKMRNPFIVFLVHKKRVPALQFTVGEEQYAFEIRVGVDKDGRRFNLNPDQLGELIVDKILEAQSSIEGTPNSG